MAAKPARREEPADLLRIAQTANKTLMANTLAGEISY
jgi:hypothetical protein